MWRETKILVIDDNQDRCRDLSVIISFLGEDQLSCSSRDWRQTVDPLPNGSRDVLSDPDLREGIKQFTHWPTIPQASWRRV